MAFHFPLMPRMYMAIAQEDRHPITDIMRQTPEIPESCQWAIFLRNHDELTLEMVTQNEREYLWNTYAADRRMRINLGIRRRLAPLLDNDRRKIELMNALLLSMPGHAGDLLRRRDRHGRQHLSRRPRRRAHADAVVARPQWRLLAAPTRRRSTRRRSRTRSSAIQAVNVEAQQQSPGSLLNWMKRLIAVRQARADVRPRHADLPLPAQPQDPGLSARARGRDASCASTISPATRRPATSSSGAIATGCRSSCLAAQLSRRSPIPAID